MHRGKAANNGRETPGVSPPTGECRHVRRQILAFLAGLVTWILVASIINRLLRAGMPGYAAAEPALTFTLLMKWSRLAFAALASLSAGYVVARLAPGARRLPLILGALVLALFLPVHYDLWDKLPVWYHLVFLISIVPLFWAGAVLAGTSRASDRAQ